jgi:hypothetical protein
MTRSRVALFVSVLVVALGVIAGLGALWLDSARAAVGPLPGEGLVLPADTQFVMGFDVKRLVASPVWERYASRPAMRPEGLKKLEAWTGLDPARDIDQIVVAGRRGAGKKQPPPLVMAMGRFDLEKLGFSLDKVEEGTTSEFEGATLFSMEKKGESSSLALLDAGTLLFGPTDRVEAVVASRSRGETPLRQNEELLKLVASVKPGSTFWVVGDQSLLAQMPKGIPAPGMGGPGGTAAMNLPPLQSLTLTGDLDPRRRARAGGAHEPAGPAEAGAGSAGLGVQHLDGNEPGSDQRPDPLRAARGPSAQEEGAAHAGDAGSRGGRHVGGGRRGDTRVRTIRCCVVHPDPPDGRTHDTRPD